ncbi:unnamed protein product [Diatraea saccharalis]|uniref:Epoxide hydrolase n=1 Tax=Diatraea saccharalis TaxID=40085 RepID=A0A9N9RA21_9NEOP|nr:unnamed protein product [Diatraea saccharalis]
MAKFIFLLAILAVGAGVWFMVQTPEAPIPHYDPEEWWGPSALKGRVDKMIKPFKVQFEESMIKDLKNRLKNYRKPPPPLEGVAFEYGFNTKNLDSWVNYWADKYNFAQREAFLNKFPQFKTNIQGLDIHFIRVKPQVTQGVQVLPLLLVHGWPGSVREFYEAIPLLTTPRQGYDFVFEVVVPSLPGYGFSDAAIRPGLAVPQTAVIFKNLMSRLGHKKFYVQGGDWGAGVVSALSTIYQDDILGHHTNMAFVQHPMATMKTLVGSVVPSLVVEPHLAERMYPLSWFISYVLEEFGYFHLQATKPDTIGVALSDSPAGLLAYILEKFSTWVNHNNKFKADGGIEIRFTKDQLIDNLMMYWSSNSITTSMRFYAENMSSKIRAQNLATVKTNVPTWAYQARYELFYQPPSILKHKFANLINVTVTDDGGHFLAFEMPEELSADIFKAVKAFKEFHVRNKKTEL